MSRWFAGMAIALLVSAATVHAQSAVFTVTVASAGIHQSPADRSPIVGSKSKGDVLDVRRDLGNWIEVAWPASPTGVAYISASMGLIGQAAPPPPVRRPMTIAEYVASTPPPASSAAGSPLVPGGATCSCAQAASGNSAPANTSARAANTTPAMQPIPTYVIPKHSFGLGARFGGVTRSALGATGRVWSRKRIGVQLELARETRTNEAAAKLSSQQIASSVIFAPPSSVGDYLWFRPYVGGGTTFYRSTIGTSSLAIDQSATDTALGIQIFGGGELTFASLPRLALSADIGFHKWPESFAVFEPHRLGIKLSGHWYVK